jgi:hypothetical protein
LRASRVPVGVACAKTIVKQPWLCFRRHLCFDPGDRLRDLLVAHPRAYLIINKATISRAGTEALADADAPTRDRDEEYPIQRRPPAR